MGKCLETNLEKTVIFFSGLIHEMSPSETALNIDLLTFNRVVNSIFAGPSGNCLLRACNVFATVRSCDTVTLQWGQPSEPKDITTSVSCTPPSPGCAECTTSPCTITGLNPSTEYEFTVTLNSAMCGTSMNTAGIGARGEIKSVT